MPKPRLSQREKETIAKQAGGCCEYCLSQAVFSPDPFSVEHIIPRSRGGENDLSNLALSCQGCNNRKYTSVKAVDPVSGETVPLYNPRQDEWSDHFVWNEDYTLIIGITPTGRATTIKLQLNREGVVNLRRLLVRVNRHPPVRG